MRDAAELTHTSGQDRVKLPEPQHECPHPDRPYPVAVEPGSDFAQMGFSHTYRIPSPSYPSGSEWRCPDCCALWRVQPYPKVLYGSQRVGTEWVKVSDGGWYRLWRFLGLFHPDTSDDEREGDA